MRRHAAAQPLGRGSRPSAPGWRPARRCARRSRGRPGAAASASTSSPTPGERSARARRPPAAGRTSGTARGGRGRRRRGTAAAWRATRRSSCGAGGRRAVGVGRRLGDPAVAGAPSTSGTSAATRCWARKMRKTASSSAGVRSRSSRRRSGRSTAREPVAEAGRAARRARRRGSAGSGGSARGRSGTRSSVLACSPAGRLRLSSARSANRVSSSISRGQHVDARRPRLVAGGEVARQRRRSRGVDVEAQQDAPTGRPAGGAARSAGSATARRRRAGRGRRRPPTAGRLARRRRRAARGAPAAPWSRPGCRSIDQQLLDAARRTARAARSPSSCDSSTSDRRAGLDLVADRDRRRDDQRGRGRAHARRPRRG